MRLLTRKGTGFGLIDYPPGTETPPYAILSHTWGLEEVTYEDLMHGIGLYKSGYRKIHFCGEQAERDGFQHFWVDTCCIDKSSSTELTESINSMFQWYSASRICYAYLEDVSSPAPGDRAQHGGQHWEGQFRTSRWFTRGWTLQELIAPTTVHFFSAEGTKLGSKRSLERLIRDVTGIPALALGGSHLHHFTVEERMAWSRARVTTRPEDTAYSLLGIFDVHMPLIYGEGKEKAFKRLREEIDKDQKGSHHEDFSVPFSLYGVPEIEKFVARERELSEMHKTLRSDGSRRTIIIHGLGGIGKTQLAIAYMKRHKDKYSAVFWLNAKDKDSLKQSFSRIAHKLRKHPSASLVSSMDNKGHIDKTIDAVKAWLSLPKNTRWLLVYDNYDNPKLSNNADSAAVDIQEYLPEAYQGSVVITTRSSRVKIGYTIRMAKMQDLNDSLEILSATSKRRRLIDDPDAVALAEELDGFPLALATAGAYLEHTSTTFGSYLRLYRESWARLQMSTPELGSYGDRTLYSTWQLSFDQIQQQNENSAALLRLWAYFDNQDIWLELLQAYNDHDIEWIREVTKDELTFASTVRTLIDYGLVEVYISTDEPTESKGYSVHNCVHSWMIHVLNREHSQDLARFAVRCVASHIPRDSSDNWWFIQRRLLRHAAKYNSAILNTTEDSEAIWIYSRLGNLHQQQDKTKEAEELYQHAIQGYAKAFGPGHVLTLDAVRDLGILYKEQNKLEEAEELYQRALRVSTEALGPDHTLTLCIVHSLGAVYVTQNEFKKAEELHQRALQGYMKTYGPGHTSTLDVFYNLGALYKEQNRFKEAEELYQRALQGYTEALGPNYIRTLYTLHSLGDVYKAQHEFKKAEEFYQRALQGYTKTYGPGHTSVLGAVHDLGALYRQEGRRDSAKGLFQQTIQILRALLKAATNRYIAAQSTGQPQWLSTLLSSDTTLVENNANTSIPESIILNKPLAIAHARHIYDTEACASFSELVSVTPSPGYQIGTQLRLDAGTGKIAKIDSIVTTAGDLYFNTTHALHYLLREDWATIAPADRDSRATIRGAPTRDYAYIASSAGALLMCGIVGPVRLAAGFGGPRLAPSRPGTPPESHIGVARRLVKEIPNAHILDQYSNENNPLAHEFGTAEEIWTQTGGKITCIVAGTGTGGTITGLANGLRKHNKDIKVVAADPQGSILALPEALNEEHRDEPYKVEGIGYDFIPEVLDQHKVDKWYKTDDKESFKLARRLIAEEGLLVGGSSGSAMAAMVQAVKDLSLGKDDVVVVILPDSIRSYLSKFADDDWLAANDLLLPTDAAAKSAVAENSNGNAPITKADDPYAGATIRSLRLKPVTSVLSSTSCAEAIETMRDRGFDQLPVLSGPGGKLVGLVTLGNLLSFISRGRATGQSAVGDVMFNFGRLDEVVTDPREGKGARRRKFVEITLDTPLTELGNFFEWNSAAVVTEPGDGKGDTLSKPVAVVTKVDLLTWMVKQVKA
ncbi:hypothetical protein NUW58_g4974 [Xylaria curta]|uniref:Uncharacterized protein n=1 Tax=Xylaria curta TaxID=42375 RepID=A0ACC1P570_9PEZI|nr:hypothetical protein NUW58_g4974 [Xylaria curta]